MGGAGFFQHAGGNAHYGEDNIDWDKLDVNIFHIGYILLLPALDQEDSEYGTRMARLLHRAQKAGMKTSIDVVSESGNRFKRLVSPALRYTDYCGNLKPMAKGRIRLTVEGGKLLGFGHACPYNEDGFLSDSSDTYYGETLAAILVEGAVKVAAFSDYGNATVELPLEG